MRRLFLLILLVFLAACSGPLETGPGLTDLSSNFSEAMRWKDYIGAANHLQPDLRKEFLDHFQKDEDLQAVGSKIVSVELDPSIEKALVDYQLEYYRLPSMKVKKWLWQQQWQRQEQKGLKAGIWRIVELPASLP